MSLLHPTEEDDAWSASHADAGLRKALKHICRLKDILSAALPILPTETRNQAIVALRMDHREETDDGMWRETKFNA